MIIERISADSEEPLCQVYREVFAGGPWYEERVCSGARLEGSDRCSVQYSSRQLPAEYNWKLDRDQRRGVVGEAEGLARCVVCERELIDYYPSLIDQRSLIRRAMTEPDFSGVILRNGAKLVGFSWGYRVPAESSKFNKVIEPLRSRGIDPRETFYGSELGVVEDEQGKGYGLLASAARLRDAFQSSCSNFLLRTKNPRVLTISRRIFSGVPEETLWYDDTVQAGWYCWSFKNFNEPEVEAIIERGTRQ